jgi:hypothetical protein
VGVLAHLQNQRAGRQARHALSRTLFQKLLLNFTWWVNRKDTKGKHLFGGGFLGLDNIGLFDRSNPLPNGRQLQQADGTAWMAFYCATMLAMALEMARTRPAYEDIASKFFEHFVDIIDAMNALGGDGLWHEADGFYYDQILVDDGTEIPLRVRSLVGIIPLLAVEVLDQEVIKALPGFRKRMRWFWTTAKTSAGTSATWNAPASRDNRARKSGCWRSPRRTAQAGAALRPRREGIPLAVRCALAVACLLRPAL